MDNKLFFKMVILPIIIFICLITIRGAIVPNIVSVQETEYGTQLNFEDGTGYWIEKK